jgi:hypothetical protein
MMRYHWGLGIGHMHAHQAQAPQGSHNPETTQAEDSHDDPQRNCALADTSGESSTIAHPQDENDDVYDSDNPELLLDDRHLEGWDDAESSDECPRGEEDSEGESTDNEDYMEM